MDTNMPTCAHAIKFVLNADAPADLAARYNDGMEVQVNVAQGDGEPVFGNDLKPKPNTYGDGINEWYNYRIPRNAKGDPVDNSGWEQNYDLHQHYDAIGITGWNFKLRRSIGIGFDYDSLETHKSGSGVAADKLAIVTQVAKRLGYVEVRKSTSGTGYHLWVWFDPENLPETANHTEHSALARAVLLKMSHDAGFDFAADVDCMGGNMWICAKRATKANRGLTLVYPAERPLTDWPRDWTGQLEVINRTRKRSRLKGVETTEEADRIEGDTRDRPRVPLDAEHRAFIEQYSNTGFQGYWQQEHGCFVGHTFAIAKVFKDMKMKGVFLTASSGGDPAKPNCWLYPLPGGSWRIFRFGQEGHVTESPTWEESPGGWKTCTINLTPSFRQIEKAFRATRLPSSNAEGLVFGNPTKAKEAVAAYGGDLGLPAWAEKLPHPRPITLKLRRGGGLLAEFKCKEELDEEDGRDSEAVNAGWTKARGPLWAKVIDVDTDARQTPYESLADNAVRQVSLNGEQRGLFVKTNDGKWDKQNADRVKDNLTHRGIDGGLQKDLLGWISDNPFYMVAKPFAGEYPGNREWNLLGSKLLYVPAEADGPITHWDMVLNHIGRGLDAAVESDPWCQEYNLNTGADYLRLWIANLIREPARRLPMLAMYSPEQGTGKSTLHLATAILFDDNGFEYGDAALKNEKGFNGELEGTALCAVEETNLANYKEAYIRIKSWVTSPRIQITYKHGTSFTTDNYTHWILSTQNIRSIPIEPGDTRIVLWEVTPYEGKEIDPDKMEAELRKEAPFFMRQLMALDLSGVCGRHTLPSLMTKEKAHAMKTVEAEKEFPGLDGDALKATEAIFRMDKPWGPGSASELCEALGDWDGDAAKKSLKSRANTLGRYLKKIQPFLEDKGVILEIGSGKQPYSVCEKVPPTAGAMAATTPATSAVPMSALQTPDPGNSQYLPSTLT
jgi:hypothetical protein